MAFVFLLSGGEGKIDSVTPLYLLPVNSMSS
jgi:hypothetical protein